MEDLIFLLATVRTLKSTTEGVCIVCESVQWANPFDVDTPCMKTYGKSSTGESRF